MNIIGILFFLLAIIPLMAVWSGYVLSILWGWFVVSLFPSAPVLSIPAAIGISLLFVYLTKHSIQQKDNDAEDFDWYAKATGKMFFVPLFFLGYGWVITQFL